MDLTVWVWYCKSLQDYYQSSLTSLSKAFSHYFHITFFVADTEKESFLSLVITSESEWAGKKCLIQVVLHD